MNIGVTNVEFWYDDKPEQRQRFRAEKSLISVEPQLDGSRVVNIQLEISPLREGMGIAEPGTCTRPPTGWGCTREIGHDGPCAAYRLAAKHDYTSTACQHGLHERCRKQCKFCSVPCRCICH